MNLTAKAQMTIQASPDKAWEALTKREIVKKYLLGADVKSDRKVSGLLTSNNPEINPCIN